MSYSFKRLLFGVAFLIAFTSFPLYAEPVKDQKLQEAFSQAEELVLESKRSEALNLLKDLWAKAKGQNRLALEQKIEELGQVFLTEKGQKAFELGQSLPWEKYKLAEAQYDEALSVEKNNLLVLKAKAALRIRESQGLKDADELEELLSITPWDQDLQAFRLHLLYKRGDLETFNKEMKTAELMKTGSSLMQQLKVRSLLDQKKYVQASEALNTLLKRSPQNPELYALKSELQKLQDQAWVSSAQKYLELCKKMQPISLKTMTENPFVCLKVEEFEKIIDEIDPQNR